MELTNPKLWKDEPVVDYINRWRSLSLDCKEKLTEISTMEMCIQGMHWGLLYILQGIKPRIFEELANWAHDMELSISSHGNTKPLILEERKERQEIRKNDRNAKSNVKDLMNINSALSTLGLDPWRRKRKPPPSWAFVQPPVMTTTRARGARWRPLSMCVCIELWVLSLSVEEGRSTFGFMAGILVKF